MSGKRYKDEFKIAAVKQVTERGHGAHDVAERFGVSIHSMYSWIKRYSVPDEERIAADALESLGGISTRAPAPWKVDKEPSDLRAPDLYQPI